MRQTIVSFDAERNCCWPELALELFAAEPSAKASRYSPRLRPERSEGESDFASAFAALLVSRPSGTVRFVVPGEVWRWALVSLGWACSASAQHLPSRWRWV